MASIMSGSDLEIETINPTQELVTFDHVKPRYYPNSKFSVGYKLGVNLEPTSKDWIGVFESDWSSVNEYITFQWASQTTLCSSAPRLRRVTFEKFSPLKYCHPDKRYRCLYVSRGDHVIGVSSSFVLLQTEHCEYELDWLELDQDYAGASELVTETSFTLVDLSSGTTSGTSEESLEERVSKDAEKPTVASLDSKSLDSKSLDSKSLTEEFHTSTWARDLDFLNQISSSKEETTPIDWKANYSTADNSLSLIPFMPVLSSTAHKPKPVVELFQDDDHILESLFQPELTSVRTQRDQPIPLIYKQDKSDDVIEHGIFDLLYCENIDTQSKPLDLSINMDISLSEKITCLDQSMKRQLLAFTDDVTYECWKNIPSDPVRDAVSVGQSIGTSSTRKERIPKMCRKRQGFCVYKNVFPNIPKKRHSAVSRKDMMEYQRKRQRSARRDDVSLHVKMNKDDVTPQSKQNSSPTLATGGETQEDQKPCSDDMKLVPLNASKSKRNNYNMRRFNAVKFLKQLFGGQHPVTSLRSLIRSESCLNCVINQAMLEDYRKWNRRAELKIDSLEKENREMSHQLELKTREVESLQALPAAKTEDKSRESCNANMDTMLQFLKEAEEINALLDDALRVSLETNKAFMSRKQQTEAIVTQDAAVSCDQIVTEESGEETDSDGWTVKSPRLVVRLRSAITKRERTLKHLQGKIENLGVQIGLYEDDIKDLRVAMKEQRKNTKTSHLEVLKLRKQNDMLSESKKQFCAINAANSLKVCAVKGKLVQENTAEKATQGVPVTAEFGATTTRDAPIVNKVAPIMKPFSQVVKQIGPITKSDGAIAKSEGVISKPDGVISKLEGAILKHEGAISKDEAPISKHEGAISKLEGAILKHEDAILKHEDAILKDEGTITKQDVSSTQEGQHEDTLPACPTGPKFENWKSFRRHLKSQISSGTCSVCSMTFSPNVDRRLIEEHITFHMQFDL